MCTLNTHRAPSTPWVQRWVLWVTPAPPWCRTATLSGGSLMSTIGGQEQEQEKITEDMEDEFVEELE